MDTQQLLRVAQQAAKQAGTLILKHYKTDVDIQTKSDNSPVTEADIEASKTLMNYLQQETEYPVVSEETPIPETDYETYWIIDPIDGTRGFINHTDMFAVHVCLIHKQQPVVAVVYKPVGDEMYYATKNNGAYQVINDKTQEMRVSKKPLTESRHVITANEPRKSEFSKWSKTLNIPHTVHTGSYGLQSATIARGDAEIQTESRAYPHAWDCAPTILLIEEAGGKVTDKKGATIPLRSSQAGKRINILATNGVVHEDMLTRLEPYA